MTRGFATGCILDAESLGPGLDLSRLRAGAAQWAWHERTRNAEAPARIGDAELVITNKVVVGEEAFASAPRLRLVCVAATGVNNVDLEAARRHGTTVCNATGYGTPSVVQHTIALMLALATRLEDYHGAARDGRWARSPHFCLLDYPITELAGRTLGVVGHGTLGRGVAEAARALGMEVAIAARPGSKTVPPGRVALADLLARADVVSLHCPLTEATRGLIGADELARMKPGAFLLNTARGGIVDEQALADALRAGTIAGAGIDVLSEEPPRAGNPLLEPGIPNLLLTPHCAWGARAARQRLVDQVAANIEAFAAGTPRNVVAGPRA
jgi:glycerate dehydrogenase